MKICKGVNVFINCTKVYFCHSKWGEIIRAKKKWVYGNLMQDFSALLF